MLISSPATASLEIYHLDGEAQARSSPEQEWQKVRENERLEAESELKIDSGSFLEVKANQNHTFRFNEETGIKFNLDEGADSIDLHYGTIEINLDPERREDKFTVHTPVSTLGVRGTKFKTAYELEKTNWSGVDSGSIWLESDTQVTLRSGQGADVKADSSTGGAKINRVGTIRKELQLTWKHWAKRKKLSELKEELTQIDKKISQLEQQVERETSPLQTRRLQRKLQKLQNQKNKISTRLETIEKNYQSLQERYSDFRQKLREKRQDFIENRQEEFAEYIEERKQKFEEFKKQRQNNMKD
ncbi:MAG: FecR domain-containing protein [bacterium]